MPWSTSFAGLSARALGWASSVLVNIYDSFARVTSGSLGNATTGQAWTAVDGVWYANSGVAQTASSPSIYPSAQFTVAENANASVVSPSPGAGIMVWETDSGDWWGAATYVTETSSPTYQCIPSSCCSSSVTYGKIESSAPAGCPGTYNGCSYSGVTVVSGFPFCTYECCVANSCCSTYIAYTTYYWSQFLAILKSVASAVSTIGTSASLGTVSNTTGSFPGPIVNSLAVTTLGTTITANVYSDTGFASLLATLSETNPSPSGTGVGILMTPSPGYQGTTVGPFTAN
jgi:hypothetical protein